MATKKRMSRKERADAVAAGRIATVSMPLEPPPPPKPAPIDRTLCPICGRGRGRLNACSLWKRLCKTGMDDASLLSNVQKFHIEPNKSGTWPDQDEMDKVQIDIDEIYEKVKRVELATKVEYGMILNKLKTLLDIAVTKQIDKILADSKIDYLIADVIGDIEKLEIPTTEEILSWS